MGVYVEGEWVYVRGCVKVSEMCKRKKSEERGKCSTKLMHISIKTHHLQSNRKQLMAVCCGVTHQVRTESTL